MITGTTIAAVSTPPGKGGVALLRVSGPGAFSTLTAVFRPKNGKPVSELPARTSVYGDILDGGDVIDDGLLTLFPAPHSYTGEDTAELCCHGGVLLTSRVLGALFAAGAVPAGPGEFTRRAMVAGRLSLSQVEAIGGVLDAKSDAQLRLFRQSARDLLSQKLGTLYDDILKLVSTVYAKIDYPDEDMADMTAAEVTAAAEELLAETDALIATYRTGHAVAEGISAVLCGKTNVGKSSLYNALCGKDAAIVTDVAGTTRDILETAVPCGKVLLRLHDTAGLRDDAHDRVEEIGIERSRNTVLSAELVLAVFDGARPFDEKDASLLALLREAPGVKIAVWNKQDEGMAAHELPEGLFAREVHVSAKTGDVTELRVAVDDLFTDGTLTPGDDAIVSSARQHGALTRAREALSGAVSALRAGTELDAAVSDLEVAMGALGECDGRTVSLDVVDRIFSSFCVGK